MLPFWSLMPNVRRWGGPHNATTITSLIMVLSKLAKAFSKGHRSAHPGPPVFGGTVVTLRDGSVKDVSDLTPGDVVVVNRGEVIPRDGTVVDGAALVDESAITGESAPVLREAGGVRSVVLGGTRVLSSRILVEVAQPARGW